MLSAADYRFIHHVAQMNLSYATMEEYDARKSLFLARDAMFEEMNANPENTFKVAHNEFSTWTEFELERIRGYKPFTGEHTGETETVEPNAAEVNWVTEGAVTPVKNQGQCGSCWAFATTEMIESYAAIATSSLPTLSSQQITSCTPNPLSCGGVGGCMGSIPQLGYTYIQLFGHATEEDYPYVSGSTTDTEDCLYDVDGTAPMIGITGYNTMSNDLEATMNHIANVGPLAVAVDASLWGGYSGGVFDSCSYSENIGLNHAVQLVGYGTDPTEGDYWIVRNSWGSRWGEDGYIRLKRESELMCGTNSTPMDGTACVGGPGNDEQHVCGQCGVLFDISYPLGVHAMP